MSCALLRRLDRTSKRFGAVRQWRATYHHDCLFLLLALSIALLVTDSTATRPHSAASSHSPLRDSAKREFPRKTPENFRGNLECGFESGNLGERPARKKAGICGVFRVFGQAKCRGRTLAGEAVLIGPVSARNSLLTGNFTGNFTKRRHLPQSNGPIRP